MNEPVTVQAARARGASFGRQAVWEAVRGLGLFTEANVRMKIPHVKESMVKSYLRALRLGGYIVECGKIAVGLGEARTQYALAMDEGAEAPRLKADGTPLPETAQQRMWRLMKFYALFTPQDLHIALLTAGVAAKMSAVESYCRHLEMAGYLAGAKGQYRLLRNTGGRAPMVTRAKVVFDPNLNQVIWHEELEL